MIGDCLVVDGRPTGVRVSRYAPGPTFRRTDLVEPDAFNDLPLDGVELILHRFLHAPAGWPEVAEPGDLVALAAAGQLEPRDTAARLTALAVARRHWPDRCHRLVFDDAWFRALPAVARTYALPPEIAAERGYERRGRHGPVHRLAAGVAGRVVSIYLDDDASAAAVVDGDPVEVSAGATGLEGLPGRMTCGDLDPAAVLYLLDPLGYSLDEVERWLHEESGLAGPGELGPRQQAHRLRRYIGAYTAVMNGLDRLVFSGAVDEGLIAAVTGGLDHLGLTPERITRTNLDVALAAATVAL